MAAPEFPGILKKGYAVIADLHLGIELDQQYLGFRSPIILEKYFQIFEHLPSKKLILLGDVKHQIFHNLKILRNFFEILSSEFNEIIITKGNHDGKLEEAVQGFENVTIRKHFKLGSTLFIHGHTRIPEELLAEVREIVLGHIHPAIQVSYASPVLSTTEPVKVILRYQEKDFPYKILVLPAANPLITGVNVLEFDFDTPALKQLAVNPENFEVILVNRILLGKIKNLLHFQAKNSK